MGVSISYMGTKRELAGAVADVVASAQDGAMLDVFSGMCSVGEVVGPSRPVWTNDAQVFASEVGRALFTSQTIPYSSQSVADKYYDCFASYMDQKLAIWRNVVQVEQELLASSSFDEFERLRSDLQKEIAVVIEKESTEYNLFCTGYADTFFGARQVLEIDSIVGAIKTVARSHAGVDRDRWLLIALGRTLLRVSNSTGHFAQFLKPKAATFRTFQRQRRRRVWDEWLSSSDELHPIGSADWRQTNRAFNSDALKLLPQFRTGPERPSVIYADPPYTDDQYSRYYHLLETMMLYDYPELSGAGRYRSSRFVTPFSHKAKSGESLLALVQSVASLGSDLVLSYPTNGLAHQHGVDLLSLLRGEFRHVEVCYAISHDHSTFGASKGTAKSNVIEKIYLGRS